MCREPAASTWATHGSRLAVASGFPYRAKELLESSVALTAVVDDTNCSVGRCLDGQFCSDRELDHRDALDKTGLRVDAVEGGSWHRYRSPLSSLVAYPSVIVDVQAAMGAGRCVGISSEMNSCQDWWSCCRN